MTEQDKRDRQLQQAQKMEAIGTLAGGIAHDFNNILAGIIGYAELVKEDLEVFENIDPKTHKRLDNMICASMRAKELIQQILTFSRSGREVKHPVCVALLVKEVVQLLRASLPATINIDLSLHSNAQVLVEPTQIHQILMNLGANARDAMEKTGGTLSVFLENVFLDGTLISDSGKKMNGSFVRLTVADTGGGIDPGIIDKIMEPFFTTKPMEKGTGMGLCVVHGIVKSLDGTIEVVPRKTLGTRFEVYLPVHIKDDDRPGPALGKTGISTGTSTGTSVGTAISGGNECILFVDDEVDLTLIAADALTNLGYETKIFASSMEALAWFSDHSDQVDLVISDVTMPEMAGDNLVREMRQIRRDIPVIFITGVSDRMDEEEARQMGVQGFLYKPFTMDLLAQAIRLVLEGDLVWQES